MVIKGMMDGWHGDEDLTDCSTPGCKICFCDRCEDAKERKDDDAYEYGRYFDDFI